MAFFSHLHVHSKYSLMELTISIKELISAAVKNDMKAIALTDKHVMSGAFDFTGSKRKYLLLNYHRLKNNKSSSCSSGHLLLGDKEYTGDFNNLLTKAKSAWKIQEE